jgi:KUP system potassium uptake protein
MTQTSSAGDFTGVVADPAASPQRKRDLSLLTLGALGVVYGDIGTSPIYAFREALRAGAGAGGATETEVMGLLSLIVWALTLTVAIKYVFFVTRADNKGEGGTLSLMSLARATFKTGRSGWIAALGVAGAALFFGDAIITPAISVLSAVEGLELVTPAFAPWIVPITLLILLGLFMVQKLGTARVSIVFGPITALWFVTLGVTGLLQIVQAPSVLWALNPVYGAGFLVSHGPIAMAVIGVVFLAVTGAEALYVDMGHFGRKPIALAWFALVFPALLLNYFGQGALVLRVGDQAAENPFFLMHPDWFLVPFVILATLATIIASQAVISGAYSLIQQAIALNMLPRMTVRHTSETQSGQIYVPQINLILCVLVMALVLGFKSSSALSAAYGIAVSGVMLVTTLLLAVVMARKWNWKAWQLALVVVPFLAIDTGFFAANVAKISQGGWAPVSAAILAAAVMTSWMAGRKRLSLRTRRQEISLESLVTSLAAKCPQVVPGTAVFLTSEVEGAPTALLHSLKHYKVLHTHNAILTVRIAGTPRVREDKRVESQLINNLFSRVIVNFGYMENPDIPTALANARNLGWTYDLMSTSFFLSRRSLKPTEKRGLRFWQDRLFVALSRNASDATEYFHIPTGRVVEIGTVVSL